MGIMEMGTAAGMGTMVGTETGMATATMAGTETGMATVADYDSLPILDLYNNDADAGGLCDFIEFKGKMPKFGLILSSVR